MKVKVNVSANRPSDWYWATYMLGRSQQSLFHFQLSYSGQIWYFRVQGRDNDIWILPENGEFPIDYFKRLCQSVYLIQRGTDEFPEIELTTRAKKLLKIK